MAAPMDVVGYLHTHVDCPACGEVVQIEADAAGETHDCDACGARLHVTEVR